MTRFIAGLLGRAPVCFLLAAVAVVVGATHPVGAFAQNFLLPTNNSLADQNIEPFATCKRNSPATTTLTLSGTARGSVVTATTGDDYFLDTDPGRIIGLTANGAKGKGLATIQEVIDPKRATVKITVAFASAGPHPRTTWARWPFCYLNLAQASTFGKYGFNTGGGHQKDNNTLSLVLDQGQQYSADRCSLAHDSYYWGPSTGDTHAATTDSACNNDHWVKFCYMKIVPRTQDEEMLLISRFVVLPGVVIGPIYNMGKAFLPAWDALNRCNPRRPWIELPANSNWIRSAAAACYGTEGALIVGVNNLALDVKEWDSGNGASVLLWQIRNACNQRWRMVPGTGNTAQYGWEIRGLGGKCLGTPPGRRPRSGDLVQMWHCDARYTQKWHHEHGQIRVQDRRPPRLCLDVNSDRAPTHVIVWKCASIKPSVNPGQQWRFVSFQP